MVLFSLDSISVEYELIYLKTLATVVLLSMESIWRDLRRQYKCGRMNYTPLLL